jgi:hypothetical protein
VFKPHNDKEVDVLLQARRKTTAFTGRNLRVGGTVFAQFDYRYNDAGWKTTVLEHLGDRVTWTYDPAQQLLSERRRVPLLAALGQQCFPQMLIGNVCSSENS